MARTVTGIVPTGSGMRICWSDNSIDELKWEMLNNRFTLTKDGSLCPGSLVNEIIESINMCNQGTALWSHLFGVSADHLSARATTQIGDTLSINTWTRLVWDDIEIESQNGVPNGGDVKLEVDTSTGIITLPSGEYRIDYEVMIHDTSVSIPSIALHAVDEDVDVEIPFSFSVDTRIGLANGPMAKRGSVLIDNSLNDSKTISIAVRSTLATTILGYHASSVPVGSQNQAGTLIITRIG